MDVCLRWFRRNGWMNERARPGKCYEPTSLEHWANTISHGVMIVPSILAGELLLRSASYHGWISKSADMTRITDLSKLHYEVSARVYGGCLVGLFLFSTLFHWLTWLKCDHPTKNVGLCDSCCGSSLWEFLHLCDRAIIFTFITGSYTPWLLLSSLHQNLTWLRWGMWVFAIFGTLYSHLFLEKYKLLETILYLAQGVLPGLAISSSAESGAVGALLFGGVLYISGVFVFKSDGFIPFAHAIWHLFVAAGASVHFWASYTFLYNSSSDMSLFVKS